MIKRLKRPEHSNRFMTGSGGVQDSTNFSQKREDWEMSVFRDATHFTVVYHVGKTADGAPHWDRQEFPKDQFPAALDAANVATTNGKPRLLYAVTEHGRQICLDRDDRPLWFERWIELQK